MITTKNYYYLERMASTPEVFIPYIDSTTVQRLRRSDFYPTFTDAIFLDIGTLFTVKPNANVVLENFFHMMWATGITRKAIR